MVRPSKRALGLMPAGIATALLLLTTSNPVYGSAADPASDPKVAAAWQAQGTLPLDVTGDAALAEERDRLRNMLKPLADYDGGMIWDPAAQVLTVQMTSDAAITQAREMVAASGTDLRVKYARVQYSAMELEELSNRLLGDQLQWAGAQGLGGGHDVHMAQNLAGEALLIHFW